MEQLSPEQLSPEWFEARRSIPTGSNFNKIITSTGKKSEQRWAYLYKLAWEAISGEVEPSYQSPDMEWGNLYEPEARAIYEMENEVDVIVPGFEMHESGLYGGSADGLVGNDGMIEIKCPRATTQVKRIDKGVFPDAEYKAQVQGYLMIYNRKWCDFVSYYPGAKWFQVRVYPDTEYQEKMHNEIVKFCEDLTSLIENLQ